MNAQSASGDVDDPASHLEHAEAHWKSAVVQLDDCKQPVRAWLGDTELEIFAVAKDPVPTLHVLAIDVSASMAGLTSSRGKSHLSPRQFGQMKHAAKKYLDHVGDDEELMVVTIGDRLEMVVSPTPKQGNEVRIREAILALEPQLSLTFLVDSLSALTRNLEGYEQRVAVVLITDGHETGNLAKDAKHRTTPAAFVRYLREDARGLRFFPLQGYGSVRHGKTHLMDEFEVSTWGKGQGPEAVEYSRLKWHFEDIRRFLDQEATVYFETPEAGSATDLRIEAGRCGELRVLPQSVGPIRPDEVDSLLAYRGSKTDHPTWTTLDFALGAAETPVSFWLPQLPYERIDDRWLMDLLARRIRPTVLSGNGFFDLRAPLSQLSIEKHPDRFAEEIDRTMQEFRADLRHVVGRDVDAARFEALFEALLGIKQDEIRDRHRHALRWLGDVRVKPLIDAAELKSIRMLIDDPKVGEAPAALLRDGWETLLDWFAPCSGDCSLVPLELFRSADSGRRGFYRLLRPLGSMSEEHSALRPRGLDLVWRLREELPGAFAALGAGREVTGVSYVEYQPAVGVPAAVGEFAPWLDAKHRVAAHRFLSVRFDVRDEKRGEVRGVEFVMDLHPVLGDAYRHGEPCLAVGKRPTEVEWALLDAGVTGCRALKRGRQ